ncbi:putative ABC transporter permease subunit [Clostridium sp. ZS2-4]|uniref:putative ABC transporter permease subunit n=1 Tax=Clostridium sp. ZS2-4 TaxID=2987703 RepID=UPI00227BFB06|nr:hypothetical protein [Clostridium sp. ZS2-4]MCY6355249.1 hypothetical protein [Clostridium sp. ZS2-4]
MSRVIALTKILLKTSGDLFGSKKDKKGSKLKPALLAILLIVCFLPLGIMIGAFVSELYDILSMIEQQGVILSLGFVLVSLIIFFFGIFYVMGTFYFSMDIDNLLPLPFKPSEILAAKFVVVLIYEYVTELLFLLPVIIAYGMKSSAGVLYYIYSILIYAVLPVIPLVLASIIVMVIMRFTGFTKNKDRFKLIGGSLAIFLSLGLNVLIQRSSRAAMNPEQIEKMFMEGNNSFVNIISKMFPSTKMASIAVLESGNMTGIMNMLIFIGISLLAVGIFLVLGEGLYLKGVVGISETTSKRKALSKEQFSKEIVENSLLKSYLMKEMKILLRTPAYFMNCVFVNLLWPLFLLIPFLAGGEGLGDLKAMGEMIDNPKTAAIVVAAGFALIVFVTSNNAVASTAISREGKNFYINKYLPVSYEKQIIAKVITAFSMGTVSMASLLLVASIIFKPPVIILFLIVVVGVFGTLFSNLVGIFVDITRPKLDWDNEQKAVKQNMNVFINGLPCAALAALTVFIVFKAKLELIAAVALIIVVFGAIDFILYKMLMTKGIERYNSINE